MRAGCGVGFVTRVGATMLDFAVSTSLNSEEKPGGGQSPTEPGLAGGMRQHRVTWRRADRPSHPLVYDQNDRNLPISGEERHSKEV